MSDSAPVVSVLCITYQHEAFLAQAIESVLMQQTDFRVELVIGEDASPDTTLAIAQDYARRYPDRVRVLAHPCNLGAIGTCWQHLKRVRASLLPCSVAMITGPIPANCNAKCAPYSSARGAACAFTMPKFFTKMAADRSRPLSRNFRSFWVG